MGTHLNLEDEELFRTIIDEGMAEIAENGFPQEQLDGIMASLSISNLLARETTGIDFVDDIFTQFPSYYASTRNCWGYIDYVNGSDKMDTWNQEGKYAELAKKWFVDNDLTVCVITSPDPGQKVFLPDYQFQNLFRRHPVLFIHCKEKQGNHYDYHEDCR